MKKDTKFDLGSYYQLPNPGLLAYFSHVEAGSDEDIRPPFWKGKSREEVVHMWDHIFETLDVDSKMSGLKAFEEEMRSKVGPLSIMKPLEERIESIEEYYKDVTLPSEPIMPVAVQAFIDATYRGKVQIADAASTVQRMRLNTNSGSPYFTKRKRVVEETLSISDREWNYVATLGWRGQEGGPTKDDVKQRVIWMFPFLYNIRELQAYNGLIRTWQNYHINSAYESMRAVEVKLTKLFDTKGDDLVVVTDFSRFDQHFNKDLQDAAHTCVDAYLYDGKGQTTFSGAYWKEFVFPIKYNIPLVCSPHLMYTGHHGMGSGSGGTNFDESCAHGAMQHEVAIKNGAKLNPYSNAYGDDGYLSFPGIDVDKVISAYTSHGQVMNPDKQSADTHSAVYLRRYFHDSYRDKDGTMLGVYSTYRALGRLLGQERFIPFDEDSKEYARYLELRAYSILENCANSPIFEQFVDFVITGDKFRLGLDLPGFLDSLDRQVKELTEMDPDLMGYTKTLQDSRSEGLKGINQWRIVKYLRSKQ